jgi:hypothetical protein
MVPHELFPRTLVGSFNLPVRHLEVSPYLGIGQRGCVLGNVERGLFISLRCSHKIAYIPAGGAL